MDFFHPRVLTTAGLLLVFAATTMASDGKDGRAWRVANNGVDGAVCGSAGSPCRSISRAIANAAPGDTILVGPGRYGDVNFDGDFDDPGDEAARPGGGVGCMICIDKRVRVLSTHGARATIVDGTSLLPAGDVPYAIDITASGVTFGRMHRGFTIRNGQLYGVHGEAANLRVEGNVATNNPAFGFQLTGSGELSHNIASGGERVFAVEGTFRLSRNVAAENSVNGFSSSGADTSLVMVQNRASGNLQGFSLGGARLVIRSNIASANQEGFFVDSPALTFERNTIVGSRGAGMFVGFQVTSSNASIHENNIYGNDSSSDDVTTNCGLVNQEGNVVDATNNYWGAPTGPGPDPADNAGAGSGCDFQGSQTLVTPFAAAPF